MTCGGPNSRGRRPASATQLRLVRAHGPQVSFCVAGSELMTAERRVRGRVRDIAACSNHALVHAVHLGGVLRCQAYDRRAAVMLPSSEEDDAGPPAELGVSDASLVIVNDEGQLEPEDLGEPLDRGVRVSVAQLRRDGG